MRRETENLLLLLVGVSIGLIAFSGQFTRYVKPGLLPWLIAAAVLLIALALAAIVADIRRGGPPDHADDGHAHRGGVVWLLAVPVVVLTFVKPPPIQAHPGNPPASLTADQAVQQQFPPLPTEGVPELSLPDVMMRAANDKRRSLDNRTIAVTAFVLHEADGVDLGRVVIICCAADAQLARVHLRGPGAAVAAGLRDNTWVRAEGVVTPAPRRPDLAPVPTLDAAVVAPIDAPANPYAYPR